ncbi:MAG TPA: acetyl-CoA carboxylase biotin carboxyl carrier protein [Gemmatimonadales bacterium]|jgi:acetyl-CoA carboxylase biotin carboxyl carrier protein|nr:acetyl-CoA carboxylase biotin carboxyl carrier protein [Gemmatimonadales bacterium]
MNIEEIRQLAQLLRDAPEVGSIEIRRWFGRGIVITRNGVSLPGAPAAPAHVVHAAPPPAARAEVPAAPSAPESAPAVALKEIKSPMVGTFYRAPEPGAEPYVKVGSRVAVGQTVCIIEAMKIMNEIEAEVSGVVREVCVEDTVPVEYGQVLFRVDPNG